LQTGFKQNLRSLKKKSFLGQLVVTLLSCELLFFASFISLSLPTPTRHNLERYAHQVSVKLVLSAPEQWRTRIEQNYPVLKEATEEVRFSSYVPLLPIAITMAYTLGLPLALFAPIIYLLLGLIGPRIGLFPFAAGGGFEYFQEPGFPYLFGIIFGSAFAAWITPDERKSWRQLLASLGGISITHLIGLTIVFGISIAVLLFEGESSYLHYQPFLSEQIRNLTWYCLPYDLLFATMLIALSFPVRWLFATLTAPDIANRHRPSVEAQLEVLTETVA
jgi:biotin transporter BioY